MFSGYLQGMGGVDGMHGQLLAINQTQGRMLQRGTAGLAGFSFRYGETNRYSKDHFEPIRVDSIHVDVPSTLMSASCQPFKHSRVSLEGKEIRLLELLPSKWSKNRDFVACRMVKRSLADEDGLRYETLSYCWGRQERRVPVFVVPVPLPVDGKIDEVVFVTPQLYAALRRLRHEEASRYLWIDQICIDQANGEEKGEQVLMMGEIYSTSWRTVIWLGEEDNFRPAIESLLRTGSKASALPDEQFFKAIVRHLEVNPEAPAELKALEHLLNRDWFVRAWIFQEAALGNDLQVWYGGLVTSFENLRRLVDTIKMYQYTKGGYARSIMKTTHGCDTIALIQHARESNCCGDSACILFKQPNLLQVLFEVLLRFRATDDRDLIYAFLAHRFQSFSHENRIHPNYSAPTERVWTDTANRIIAETRRLDIFAAARANETAKYPGLPSWVPDWTYCFPYARPIYAPDLRSNFDSSHGRDHVPFGQPPHNPSELHVRGKIIRTVSWLGSLSFEISYYRDGIASFLRLDQHVKDIRQHLTLQRRVRHEQLNRRWPDLRTSVLQTLLADGAFSHDQPLTASTREIERVMQSETEIVEKQAQLDGGRYVENVNRWRRDHELLEKLWGWSQVAQKKVVFTTEGPLGSTPSPDVIDLGLASSAIRPGDKVAILHGSRVPVVLRQGPAGWLLVSQCYLQGWMYSTDNRIFWPEDEADLFILV